MSQFNNLPEAIQQFKTPLPHMIITELEGEAGCYNIFTFSAPDHYKFSFSNGQLTCDNLIPVINHVHTFRDNELTLATSCEGYVNSIAGSGPATVVYSTVALYDESFGTVIYEADEKINCDLTDFYEFNPEWFNYAEIAANFDAENDALIVTPGNNVAFFIVKNGLNDNTIIEITKDGNYFYPYINRDVIYFEYKNDTLYNQGSEFLSHLPQRRKSNGKFEDFFYYTNVAIFAENTSVIRGQGEVVVEGTGNWDKLPEGIKQFKTPLPHIVVMKLEAEGMYNIFAFAAPDSQKFTIAANGRLTSQSDIIPADTYHLYNATTNTLTPASKSNTTYSYIAPSATQKTASADYILFSTVDLYDSTYSEIVRVKDEKPLANCNLDDYFFFKPEWLELEGMENFDAEKDAMCVLYKTTANFYIFIIKDAKNEAYIDLSVKTQSSYHYVYLDKPREVIKLEYKHNINTIYATSTGVIELLAAVSTASMPMTTLFYYTNIPVVATDGASVIRPQQMAMEVLPEEIIVEPDSITGFAGDTVELDIKVLPENANNKSYTIKTSSTSYAKVSGNVVSLVKAGTANITVTSDRVSSVTTTVPVTIEAPYAAPVVNTLKVSPTAPLETDEVSFTYTSTVDSRSEIVEEIWTNKRDQYEAGEHTVTLQLLDDKGLYSEEKSITFTVAEAYRPPVITSFTMTPENPRVTDTIKFDYTAEYDRSSYSTAEWENKASKYEQGYHTVRVRIQDSHGLWSEWAELTFYVDRALVVPVVNSITVTPGSPMVGQPVEFDYTYTIDPDATIVEEIWTNKQNVYEEAGSQTVLLKVIDSFGHESASKSVKFTVQSAYSAPEIANLRMTPSNPQPGETVSFSYDKNLDSRLQVKQENWVNKQSSYEAGTHTVKLTVTDTADQTSNELSLTFSIEQPLEAPVISNLRIDPATPNAGEEVSFIYDKVIDERLTLKTENWVGKQDTYEAGQHTVTLSITDSADQVSNTLSLTFEVVYVPEMPVLNSIAMTPTTPIAGDAVNFTYQATLDPKATVQEEIWEGKQESYEAGDHEVALTLVDSFNQRSNRQTLAFEVAKPFEAPIIDSLTVNPSTPYHDEAVEFHYNATYDRAELQAEEWENKQSYYNPGTHVVKVRVQDTNGLWSEWKAVEFEVLRRKIKPSISNLRIASPVGNIYEGDEVQFAYDLIIDEELELLSENWVGKRDSYAEAGEYTVKLSITDSDNQVSNELSLTFEVLEVPADLPPEPDGYPYIYDVVVDPPHPRVGELLSYSYTVALAKGTNVKTMRWTDKQVVYSEEGMKAVTLEVIDDRGLSNKRTIEFEVLEASDEPQEPKPMRVKHLEVTRWDSASKRFLILEGREK